MDRILYTAMSGARQSMDQQAVVNNNLANVATPGFRAELSAMRAVPVQGDGLATRTSVMASTPGSDFTPGPLSTTGRELDVAIDGEGMLAVQTADGEAYTRRGDLQVDANGVVNVMGRPVMGDGGPIIVPLGAEVSIGADGTMSAVVPGGAPNTRGPVGQLKLVNPERGSLVRGEDGLFRPQARWPASGRRYRQDGQRGAGRQQRECYRGDGRDDRWRTPLRHADEDHRERRRECPARQQPAVRDQLALTPSRN